MNKALEKRYALVTEAGRKMDAALAKLGLAAEAHNATRRRGRLMFGLDLTSSRRASLENARTATAAMFDAIKSLGSIAVKLAYYRGSKECQASAWHDDPGVISRVMARLACEAGFSQIARILRFALTEPERLDGVVFIGDHCEEKADDLVGLAAALGKRSIPLFIFHECADNDQRSLEAKPLFKRMAEISGGVYCEFNPKSASVLRELLSTIGAFSVAWHEGVKQMGTPVTAEARRLQQRLLLPAGSSGAMNIVNKTKAK